ncbi:Atg2p KNAG_0F00730 [Huiozyma naganishii CBS 8797]|uniref:Autophagy-related protein 2 n=1 Tax=Huiozyma naganishii (strain ATCC MYA-139 / BCRC 22969 / CBS 8797 / KCTC 17520 / NBRC 10181 / NCYC 3082 / Yp74L-3) TaxID=1071383 RepID=J7RZS3_HUIN7|nr:hypothetical protein KNAG_0F00730 [Kazachstania naganishii CBS 8797]CCK70742.1 hypothetical protein KNAG_0F00730 [Kazachstania naganishii CBS 8797]
MGLWLPQSIQRKVLLHFLQQISIFSDLDTSNLDVSLGSNSKFSFKDINLHVDELNLPNAEVKSGAITQLDLQLAVSGGLDVLGTGLHFVVQLSPDGGNDDEAEEEIMFSLGKSIQNLASTVIQFTDDETREILFNDDVEESSSGSSGTEQDPLQPPHGGPENQKVSTLTSMRNRVLNVILGKLTIVLKNITFTLLDSNDCEKFEFFIEKVTVLTRENGIRQISMTNLQLHSVDTNNSDGASHQDESAEVAMTESIYYSKVEGTSLYLSAIETPLEQTFENEDFKLEGKNENKNKTTLVHTDYLRVSFEGLTSVDNVTVSNVTVDINEINLYLHNVTTIRDPLISEIIDYITDFKIKEPPEISTEQELSATAKSPAYQRFQSEQNLEKEGIVSFVCINLLKISIANENTFILGNLSINQENNMTYKLSIDYMRFEGNHLQVKTKEKPFFQGTLTPKETMLELHSQIDIKIEEAQAPPFVKSVKSTTEFFDFLNLQFISNSRRRHPFKGKHRATSKLPKPMTFKVNSISITLELPQYNISAVFDPMEYSSKTSSLHTERCSIIKVNKERIDEIFTARDISFELLKRRIEIKTFNENLKDCNVHATNILNIKSFSCTSTLLTIETLFSDLNSLFLVVFPEEKSELEEKRLSCMKKSVRLLASSHVISKQQSIASLVVKVEMIKVKLKDILENDTFGSLKVRLSDVCMSLSELDGSLLAFANFLELNRIAPKLKGKQTIIKRIKNSDNRKPVFLLTLKSDEKIKIKLRSLELHYYAKWLDLLREVKEEQLANTVNVTTDISSQSKKEAQKSCDLTFIDCSLLLHPYRLNAGIAVVVDHMVVEIIMVPKLKIKAFSKSASLLLIDDLVSKREKEKFCSPNVPNFYGQIGFITIGRLNAIRIRFQKEQNISDIKINVDSTGLSLCADSLYTLIQVGIDLKFPESFPDEAKYKTHFDHDVNIFENVDFSFFQDLMKEEPDSTHSMSLDNGINVVESFFDVKHDNSKTPHLVDLNKSDYNSSNSEIADAGVLAITEDYIDTRKAITVAHSRKQEGVLRSDHNEQELSILLNLEIGRIAIKFFDGYDWKHTRRTISSTVNEMEIQKNLKKNDGTPDPIPETNIFESIFIEQRPNVDLNRQINANIQGIQATEAVKNKLDLYPSKNHKVLINISDVRMTIKNYEIDQPTESQSDGSTDVTTEGTLEVSQFDVVDNVLTSSWNKFATLLRQGRWPVNKPMISMNFSMVRPVDYLPALELRLETDMAPLRLHVDQDTLDFLIRFSKFRDPRFVLIDEYPETIFIQKFAISEVRIKLDYKPKKVDYVGLKSGHATELMNFFTLDESMITLKGIQLYGINGFDELDVNLRAIWTPDIIKRQLGGVLSGITPVKSFITFGSGVKTFVTVLMSDYRSDGHLKDTIKQQGNIFLKTSTGEFIKLGVRVASGTQNILESAERYLTDGERVQHDFTEQDILDLNNILNEDQLVGRGNPRVHDRDPSAVVIDASGLDRDGNPANGSTDAAKVVSLYSQQPLDIHHGLEDAYHSLEKHIQVAYNSVWNPSGRRLDGNGTATAAAVSVARVAPIAIIRPLIGATEAISKTLQGVVNQFDKEHINEVNDKYR